MRQFQYTLMRKAWDADNNNRVTKDEFTAAAAGMTCCGGLAPFWCNCDSLAYQVFPPVDTSRFDRFDVTFRDFAAHVLAQNLSWAIPRCHTAAHVQPPPADAAPAAASAGASGGTATPTTQGSTPTTQGSTPTTQGSTAPRFTLSSAHGEVIVTVQQAVSAWKDDAVAGAASYSTPAIYSPPNKAPGLRLASSDAQRLMKTYGITQGGGHSNGAVDGADANGASSGTNELYLVIDVESGPGVPSVRWVYSSNPAYLVLDLSALSYLSAGMMRPAAKFERVRFLNNDCSHLDGAPLDAAAYNATLAQMHTQLFRALHASAFDKAKLPGVLAVQGHMYDEATGGMRLEYFSTDLNPDPASLQPWSSGGLASVLSLSVSMSVLVGLVLGSVVLLVLIGALRRRHASWLRSQRSIRRIVLRHHYGAAGLTPEALHAQILADTAQDARADAFTLVLRLIQEFTTAQLTSKLSSSLDVFLAECTEKTSDATADFVAESTRMLRSGMGGVAALVRALKRAPPKASAPRTQITPTVGPPVTTRFPATAEPRSKPHHGSPAGKEAPPPLGSGVRFVYMRRLFRQYELFCLQRGLAIENSRSAIQRELVREYGVRVDQVIVQRLRGVRWKPSVLAAFHADEDRRTKLWRAAAGLARGGTNESQPAAGGADARQRAATFVEKQRPAAWSRAGGWLRQFLSEHCDVTRLPGDCEPPPPPACAAHAHARAPRRSHACVRA